MESKPQIMIVDDDPMIGKCLTLFLEGHNYRVIFFTDGNKALDYLKSNNVNNPSPILSPKGRGKGEGDSVDFLLTDMQMPAMTGLELLRQVKALFPALPVIVMSGSADGADRDEIFALGADFIAKPFELADVRHKVAMATSYRHGVTLRRHLLTPLEKEVKR